MRPPTEDALAGERARKIRANPGAPQRVSDPTDPRYGKVPPETGERAGNAQRIVDPTDPGCGDLPD
jgi:hypothetical protein